MKDTLTLMNVEVFVSPNWTQPGVVMPKQAHTNVVAVVKEDTLIDGECDALITQVKEITLGVHTRDCAPICISDGTKIGIAHVGWSGLSKGLITEVRKHFGNEEIEVFVGPHLHTFEIQRDFCYDAVTSRFGDRFLEEKDGTLIFHFKDAIASELPESTVFDGRSTAFDRDLPSHRHKRNQGHIITTVKRI